MRPSLRRARRALASSARSWAGSRRGRAVGPTAEPSASWSGPDSPLASEAAEMLSRSADEAVRLTRRELVRLIAVAGVLILAMTITMGVDLSPRLDLKVGDLAPGDIRAPRAQTFDNQLLTEAAREAARNAVPPQYDFTSERAISIASEQVSLFTKRVAPLDTAFSPGTSPEDRQLLLNAPLT